METELSPAVFRRWLADPVTKAVILVGVVVWSCFWLQGQLITGGMKMLGLKKVADG